MSNNRIYYAIHQVGVKDDGGSVVTAVHGLQSVGMTTNFNLDPVFELGQLNLYENIESVPDVEVTLSKVLDGYPLIYHLATKGSTTTAPTLSGRSTTKCAVLMSIFEDTDTAAEGTPQSVVQCSGMYVSSVSYNFPLEDNFTEDVTLVGNDRVWANQPGFGDSLNSDLPTPTFAGAFNESSDDAPQGAGGVNRRENLVFDSSAEPYCCKLPPEVNGISNDGYNTLQADGSYAAHISNITVSVDLGREQIFELGHLTPYHRYVSFPIEVTCDIEVTSTGGDFISATENGIYTTTTDQCDIQGNLKDRTIRLFTCEGTYLYLGDKNKLSSVNYAGGDTGGGNVTVTYSFSNYNDFVVLHSGDPHSSGNAWYTSANALGWA